MSQAIGYMLRSKFAALTCYRLLILTKCTACVLLMLTQQIPCAGPNGAAQDVPSPSTVSQMSKTELYVKYAEATNSWKEERLRNRQNEILLDTVRTLFGTRRSFL